MNESFSEETYRIEQFTLTENLYEQIAELITDSYLYHYSDLNLGFGPTFKKEKFNYRYGSPYLPRDTFIRAIHIPTDTLVGFAGIKSGLIKINYNIYKVAIDPIFAVAYEHQHKYIATNMGLKLTELLIEREFDLVISLSSSYTLEKEVGRSIIRSTTEGFLVHQTLFDIQSMMVRVLDYEKWENATKIQRIIRLPDKIMRKFDKMENISVRKYKPEDSKQIFDLMEDNTNMCQISIKRNFKDFQWYLNQPGIICSVHVNDNKELNGFLIAEKQTEVSHDFSISTGIINKICLNRLSSKEATLLCNCMLYEAKKSGWVLIGLYFIPYFEDKPFYKSGFMDVPSIFTNQRLTIDVYQFKKIEFPAKIKSFYL